MKKPAEKIKLWALAFALLTMIVIIGYGTLSYLGSRAIVKQMVSLKEIEEMPAPTKDQKIMVFAPHQDDETLGAGGYVATAEQNGAQVKIVLVTNGNKRKIARIRFWEFGKAVRELGVPKEDVASLNYGDSTLRNIDRKQIKANFENQIKDFNPDVVIGPSSHDAHPDHSVTGSLLEEIKSGQKYTLYEYLIHYRRFPASSGFAPKSYLLPPIGLASEENWKYFLLSPEAEKRKSKAEGIYRSQLISPVLQKIFTGLVRRNELFYKVY